MEKPSFSSSTMSTRSRTSERDRRAQSLLTRISRGESIRIAPTESRLVIEQSVAAPTVEEPSPEVAPSSEVGLDFIPVCCELRGSDESPHVRVPRFAQDLPEHAKTLGARCAAQELLQLCNRHRVVPQEVGDGFRVVEIG